MGALRFVLNSSDVALEEVGASDTLLDFLRLQRGLTGTKEGCAEGDCGACTVLAGRMVRGQLVYEPVNACIRLLASCHGCHVVTVEHLRGQNGGLHPVQQAMVEHHASQCGFCTPGIVMALYGLWMGTPSPTLEEIETALQGNLCRCTGYDPIVKAARAASEAGGQAMDALARESAEIAARLTAIPRERVDLARGGDRAIIPADTHDLAAFLTENPNATIIAGATDVGLWITKFLRPISPAVFIGHLMKDIFIGAQEIRIGAGVTFSEARTVMETEFPEIADYWSRIAGWQVRNMGTIGGNIANGSPIGDTPPILMALGARIVLRLGDTRREVALDEFFIDYGKQDRRAGEFVEEIVIPRRGSSRVAAYKVSKRRDSDISSVAAGIRIVVQGGVITEACLAFGGMAGTPRRASAAEAALLGHAFNAESFERAAVALADDFEPLSDMRASRDYRRVVAANLLRRFWLEQSGEASVRLTRIAGE